MPKTKSRSRPLWRRLPSWLSLPVNAEEFKFCCVLYGAAHEGRVATRPLRRFPTPAGDEEVDLPDFSADDLPFHRGMTAVREHFQETRQSLTGADLERERHEFLAMMWRISELGDFVSRCLEQNDRRIDRYAHIQNGEILAIEDPLLEAAATAPIGRDGQFRISSMFAIADARSPKLPEA